MRNIRSYRRKLNSSAVRKLNASRSSIIDELDKYYNEGDYELVEQLIESVTGVDINAVDTDNDDSEEEGFWGYFTTESLSDILEAVQNAFEEDEKANTIGTLSITRDEYDVLKDAMENYSDVSFSRDSEMAKTARKLLQKLNNLYYR